MWTEKCEKLDSAKVFSHFQNNMASNSGCM